MWEKAAAININQVCPMTLITYQIPHGGARFDVPYEDVVIIGTRLTKAHIEWTTRATTLAVAHSQPQPTRALDKQ